MFVARGKGPKNSIHKDLLKRKKPKQKSTDPQLRFMRLTVLDRPSA